MQYQQHLKQLQQRTFEFFQHTKNNNNQQYVLMLDGVKLVMRCKMDIIFILMVIKHIHLDIWENVN
jgi:hypothetical protein